MALSERERQRQRRAKAAGLPRYTRISDFSGAAAGSSASLDDPLAQPVGQSGGGTTGPWTISGTALGTETIPGDDYRFRFTPEALEKVAPTLADNSESRRLIGDGLLVTGHGEDADDVVGELTESRYNPETETVEYEAEIDDFGLTSEIRHGRLEVSPRVLHAKAEMMEQDEDGVYVVGPDAAKRLINLSVEQSSRSESSTAESGPLEDLAAGDPPADAWFDPTNDDDTDTVIDMSSDNSDTDDSTDDATIEDLRAKLEQARELGNSGMVRHYEARLSDLRAGEDTDGSTADLGARDEPSAYDGDDTGTPATGGDREYDDAHLERMERMGWGAAAEAVRERQDDAEPDADDDTAAADLSPREAAEKVNELRNKHLTAARMGDEDMVEHYEEQIADLIGNRSDIGGR
jgi:hypothetical protein